MAIMRFHARLLDKRVGEYPCEVAVVFHQTPHQMPVGLQAVTQTLGEVFDPIIVRRVLGITSAWEAPPAT